MKKGFDWVCEETRRMCDVVVVCCIKHFIFYFLVRWFEKIVISNFFSNGTLLAMCG